MSEGYAVGLYNAVLVKALYGKVLEKDKESGQEVEKSIMFYEASLSNHVDKQGNKTEVTGEPIIKWRKYLVGGCLTGKGGEITLKELAAIGGDLFATEAMGAFCEPINEKLVGRNIQLMNTRGDNPKYPDQWTVYVPGSAAPVVAATKSDVASLNALLGIAPAKKAPAPQATAPVGDVAKDVF